MESATVWAAASRERRLLRPRRPGAERRAFLRTAKDDPMLKPLLAAAALIAAPLIAAAADSPPPPAKPPAVKATTKLGQCSSEAKKKGLKGAERKKFVSECAKSSSS
jgi:psiF repeat-containing protein